MIVPSGHIVWLSRMTSVLFGKSSACSGCRNGITIGVCRISFVRAFDRNSALAKKLRKSVCRGRRIISFDVVSVDGRCEGSTFSGTLRDDILTSDLLHKFARLDRAIFVDCYPMRSVRFLYCLGFK